MKTKESLILNVLKEMNELYESTNSENPIIGKKILDIEGILIKVDRDIQDITNDLFMLTKNVINEKQETVTISVTEMLKYVSKLIAII